MIRCMLGYDRVLDYDYIEIYLLTALLYWVRLSVAFGFHPVQAP